MTRNEFCLNPLRDLGSLKLGKWAQKTSERGGKRPGSAPRSALDRIRGFPGPRQQLVDAVYGVSIDHAREHVMQVGVGLDVIKLAALCRPPNYAESGRFPRISG